MAPPPGTKQLLNSYGSVSNMITMEKMSHFKKVEPYFQKVSLWNHFGSTFSVFKMSPDEKLYNLLFTLSHIEHVPLMQL